RATSPVRAPGRARCSSPRRAPRPTTLSSARRRRSVPAFVVELPSVRRMPAEALLVGAVLLWSFNYTAVRFGVTHGFTPLAYAPLRWLLAGLALATIVWTRGRSVRIGKRDLTVLALVSLVGIVANQVTLLYALKLAPASTVALVFGMLPVLISL